LKSSTQINEFYDEKKLDIFATDMLTRTFSYYYFEKKWKKLKALDTIKRVITLQFEDKFNFFISRIFANYLKRVRFDRYYNNQEELFKIVNNIIEELPKDDFVSIDNILRYCKYRDMRFHFGYSHKTGEYYVEGNDDIVYNVGYNYYLIFFDPIIKAVFFYLGAMGLFELKYDKPTSENENVKAKNQDYLSVWDSLRYIKFTGLGKYIFGLTKSYTPKKVAKKESKIKFDEYKPIITVDKSNTIILTKLESYCDKYDEDRYILSYNKIFKDCKNYKLLELKIENFYKQIESKPPKVFCDFFDNIKLEANLLKRDLKQVVINLKNNKRLLNLFMTNKKLQELIIKAQGYRIIVEKANIPKLTKIVKDNGFFIDF
jgi:hypothetical protein